MDAEGAYAKIRAGATLVQVYTGFVYGGPGFVRRVNAGLAALLARDGYAHLADAVAADDRGPSARTESRAADVPAPP